MSEPKRMSSEVEAVKVKPLEWDGNEAGTPFGTYTVADDAVGLWHFTFHCYPYGDEDEHGYRREDHAKAAAQADYEARIRSALAAPLPKPAGWLHTHKGTGLRSLEFQPDLPPSREHWTSEPVYTLAAPLSKPDIEGLVEALKPFADFAEYLEVETEGFSDGDEIQLTTDDGLWLHVLKVGDFRRVRAALAALTETSS